MGDSLWRGIGYVVLPIAATMLTWIAVSSFLGETMVSKGIAMLLGGLVLSSWDIGYRILKRSSSIPWAIVAPRSGVPDIVFVPLWGLGFLVAGGGISLILNP